MRAYDLILKKREGEELAQEEINYLISEYVKGNIPDYQMAAFLMAVYFKKMTLRETIDFTMAMVNSGDKIDLSNITGIKVDKHSTGGVGDKTSLVLGPMVASCGVKVAKMSGRGLGHTGGTLDKLEAIPGFRVDLKIQEFIEQVENINIAITGQTTNLVPADKKLYSLRDVTATVDNTSLIASSIMSKKIAGGSDVIILDVKTGSGAFLKDLDGSIELAKMMVDIGNSVGKQTIALITNMDQPLGRYIGNALEIKEVIHCLKGRGPSDLIELCLYLGSYMLLFAKKADGLEEAKQMLKKTISNKTALQKFKQLIEFQGGKPEVIENINLLPKASFVETVKSKQSGYIHYINTEKIGICAMKLGAGREKKEDNIDPSVGIELIKKIGDPVKKGETIARIYGRQPENIRQIKNELLTSFIIKNEFIDKPPLVYGIVTQDGFKSI